jgi:hypothetical protein
MAIMFLLRLKNHQLICAMMKLSMDISGRLERTLGRLKQSEASKGSE